MSDNETEAGIPAATPRLIFDAKNQAAPIARPDEAEVLPDGTNDYADQVYADGNGKFDIGAFMRSREAQELAETETDDAAVEAADNLTEQALVEATGEAEALNEPVAEPVAEISSPVLEELNVDPKVDEPEDPDGTNESQDEETTDPVEAAPGSEDPDLDQLSVEDLKRHQEEVQRKIEEKQKAEKQAVIDQIVNVVKTYNISTEELVEALGGLKIKRKGVKAKTKYFDPATGLSWSGRGKTPNWLKGKDPEQYRVRQTG